MGQRSIMAQFRLRILPLSIETGKYTYIPEVFRLCIFCQVNMVEIEEHILFQCSNMRDKLV